MDRLFRPQYLTVALLMVVCLALMTLVLPRFPDKVCNIPLWILIISEYLFTLGVSICAQLQSIRQSFLNLRLAPGLILLGIVFLIAAISVTFSPINGWASEGRIAIGLMQLIILNLAILFSIFIITTPRHAEFEEVLTEKESSTANTTNIKRLTKIRIKAMPSQDSEEDTIIKPLRKPLFSESSASSQATDPKLQTVRPVGSPTVSPLQGLVKKTAAKKNTLQDMKALPPPIVPTARESQTRKAVDISTVAKLLTPPGSQSFHNLKPVTKELPPEIQRLPSINVSKTQNKIDQPKKPVGSASSKLQALSASGTGAAHMSQSGVDALNLKSVLDRLDSNEEVRNLEELAHEQTLNKKSPLGSAQAGATLKHSVDEEMDNLFAKIAPETKSQIGKTEFFAESKTEYPVERKEETGVFKNKVDSDVEEIFSGMVPAEAQREVNKAESDSLLVVPTSESQGSNIASGSSVFGQPIEEKDMDSLFAKIAPEAKPEIGQTEVLNASDVEPKLFSTKVDDQVDEIFSGMAPAAAQKEVASKKSGQSNETKISDAETTGDRSSVVAGFDASVSEPKRTIPELKDFGRLSSRASAESETTTQAGTMKTIGKLLLDSDAMDNIIKKADSGKITINLPSAKVISQLRGQGIRTLLGAIDSFEGVEGSMLIGKDGLVILSTLITVGDRDGTGVLAHGMLGNSNIGTEKLDLGNLEQMILVTHTDDKNTKQLTTVLTDVEVGVLAVFLDIKTITGLDDLIEKISSIANG